MSDTAQDQIDLDTLTDDQVMELDPAQVQALMDQEGEEDVTESNSDEDTESDDTIAADESDDDTSNDGDESVPSSDGEDSVSEDAGGKDTLEASDENDTIESDKPSDTSGQPEGTDAKKDGGESPKSEKPAKTEEPKADEDKDKDKAVKLSPDQEAAMDFFNKVSAPFKADGREMQVRSPEDAIRLMQMGVNYSRRMQQMKPLRAMEQMLSQHGLNDPQKLNELIDIHKGNPAAIQKLLREKNIDPLDIDTSKDNGYKATDYRGDPKDLDFKEAIENTLAQPGGRELIADVNAEWDDNSKSALRDQPAIFQNLLEQKSSGVYGKIVEELKYQRTMGHLTNVPFLQAYHQVGDAMQKAGVFGSTQPHSNGAGQMQVRTPAGNPAPIDTGPRKAAPKPKTEQPNPNLSSTTPPRAAPSNGQQQEPDYATMSDEEFLKLGMPG